MTATLTPQVVIRDLHGAGIQTVSPSDPNREGIKVTRNYKADTVTLTVDIDLNTESMVVTTAVMEALTGLGYSIRPNSLNPAILYVSRPGGTS